MPVVTPGKGRFQEVTLAKGLPAITLLSPSPDRLTALAGTWDREMERLRRKEREAAAAATALPRGVAFPALEALAARISPTDKAPANGSSIAILLEHRGASVLPQRRCLPDSPRAGAQGPRTQSRGRQPACLRRHQGQSPRQPRQRNAGTAPGGSRQALHTQHQQRRLRIARRRSTGAHRAARGRAADPVVQLRD